MEIDWEAVAEEADNTPRSLLAEVLAEAEEIDAMIILVKGKDGVQREWFIASQELRIAMLAVAHHSAVLEVVEGL